LLDATAHEATYPTAGFGSTGDFPVVPFFHASVTIVVDTRPTELDVVSGVATYLLVDLICSIVCTVAVVEHER